MEGGKCERSALLFNLNLNLNLSSAPSEQGRIKIKITIKKGRGALLDDHPVKGVSRIMLQDSSNSSGKAR